MATGVVSWSQTAASNNSADSSVNWAEGQAPSTVNDSARGMMASTAKYRDDTAGAIATGGTSTAYTVTSYQTFGSLSALANQEIAFTPHTACGATVTLAVDGLTAKPLRAASGVELVANQLVAKVPYVAVYNSSDQVFYVRQAQGAIKVPGTILSTGTAGVGFATGAGSTVTQSTSRSTGVTINAPCGQIVTDTTSLAAATGVSFTVTNSAVASTDAIILNVKSGLTVSGSTAQYYYIKSIAAGSFDITYFNPDTLNATTTAVTFNFAVIKGVTS